MIACQISLLKELNHTLSLVDELDCTDAVNRHFLLMKKQKVEKTLNWGKSILTLDFEKFVYFMSSLFCCSGRDVNKTYSKIKFNVRHAVLLGSFKHEEVS